LLFYIIRFFPFLMLPKSTPASLIQVKVTKSGNNQNSFLPARPLPLGNNRENSFLHVTTVVRVYMLYTARLG
jgi:hypothetical protein